MNQKKAEKSDILGRSFINEKKCILAFMEEKRTLSSCSYFRSYPLVGYLCSIIRIYSLRDFIGCPNLSSFLSPNLIDYEESSSKFPPNRSVRVICYTVYFNSCSFHAFTNSSAFNGGNKVPTGIWKHGSFIWHWEKMRVGKFS